MNTPIAKSVSYDQGCLRSVRKLPDYVSGKFLDLMARYMDNPASNGLNFETVEGSKDKSLKSLRLDQSYRAIAFETDKHVMFVHVNEHDKAYRWAKGRRVKLDTATNRIRIVEEVEQEQQAVAAPKLSEEKLFDDFKDKKLIQLGVAEESLPIIREIADVEQLEASEERLDPLSFQVLYGLAAGYTEEEVYALVGRENETENQSSLSEQKSFDDLLDTAESRQTIFTPETIEELRRFFDGELADWRVWLHPDQRKLAYRNYNGPAMVRGGAGTGKTVVAMHRAKYLADSLSADPQKAGQRVLVTTFTRTLAKDIEANLRTLCPKHFEGNVPRIEVVNLDRWAANYLSKKQFDRKVVNQNADELTNLWQETFDEVDLPEGLSEAFVKAEWEQIVQAKGISDQKAYLRVSRAGRGTPLNRQKRAHLWGIFERYRAGLIQEGIAERDDVYREAIPLLESEPGKLGYASVVVDEAQDMGEQAFRLIRAILPNSEEGDRNSIFIVGDAHQRIYNRRASMSQCGIHIVGRSRKLKLNYRTTHKIRELAVAILGGINVDDLDTGSDNLEGYISVHHGLPPELRGYKSDLDEVDALAEWIKELTSGEDFKPSDVGVLLFTNKQADDIKERLEALGISVLRLAGDNPDDQKKPGVRVSTMHRSKGLEFKAVAIPNMSASNFPPEWILNKAIDDADREDQLLQLRSLLHVATTRAKEHLRISWSGEASDIIPQISVN
ncbi:MAG: ATP-dependent helicase [Pseudohongiellaceae bacterium]